MLTWLLQQIGKTSSLVLTLCGVLKDILLVTFSILYWGTTVTFLQFVGYGVALCGLVYYKLGGEKIKEHVLQIQAQSQQNPKLRLALMAGAAFFAFTVLYFAYSDLTRMPVPVNDGPVKGV